MKINDKLKLGLGLNFGVLQFMIDGSKILIRDLLHHASKLLDEELDDLSYDSGKVIKFLKLEAQKALPKIIGKGLFSTLAPPNPANLSTGSGGGDSF